ncbi:hypothetical protein V6N13_007755 [Hibiscus sabdariffa]
MGVLINIDATYIQATKLSSSGIINLQSSTDLSDIGPLTRDIKALSASFDSYRFIFASRKNNRPTQALASEGLRNATDRLWVEDAPESILRLAAVDRRFSDHRSDPP